MPGAALRRVTGPAGFAFAENTLVFHRGTAPICGHRAILNLIYTEARFRPFYPTAFELQSATAVKSH